MELNQLISTALQSLNMCADAWDSPSGSESQTREISLIKELLASWQDMGLSCYSSLKIDYNRI